MPATLNKCSQQPASEVYSTLFDCPASYLVQQIAPYATVARKERGTPGARSVQMGKYEKAMKDNGWMKTSDIAAALGRSPACVTGVLTTTCTKYKLVKKRVGQSVKKGTPPMEWLWIGSSDQLDANEGDEDE